MIGTLLFGMLGVGGGGGLGKVRWEGSGKLTFSSSCNNQQPPGYTGDQYNQFHKQNLRKRYNSISI